MPKTFYQITKNTKIRKRIKRQKLKIKKFNNKKLIM